MLCPNCHAEIGEGKKFCGKCGSALGVTAAPSVSVVPTSLRCPRCGSEVSPGEKFCGNCGGAIGPELLSRPVTRLSPIVFASVTAAVVLLVSGGAWYFFGRGLHTTKSSAEDLLYIPSSQGVGLVEIHPAQPAVRRIAETTGFNNALVVYNSHRNEFYVGLTNGDHVAIIDGDAFLQVGKFADGVGWNTSGLELSHDGNSVVITGSDAKLLLFNTRTRALTRRINNLRGGYPTYAVFAPDDRALYVSSGDSLSVFDPSTLELKEQRISPGWQASPMVVSPDGTALFLLQSGTLIRWSTRSLSVSGSTVLPESGISSYNSYPQISRDGSALWAAGKHAIYRVPLSLEGYTMVQPPEPAQRSSGGQYQFAESSDEKCLYVVTGNDARANLLILDVRTSSLIRKITDIPYPSMVLVRSSDSMSSFKVPQRRPAGPTDSVSKMSSVGPRYWTMTPGIAAFGVAGQDGSDIGGGGK
jgi:DNA-binding beta-propeller fold protein YncE